MGTMNGTVVQISIPIMMTITTKRMTRVIDETPSRFPQVVVKHNFNCLCNFV